MIYMDENLENSPESTLTNSIDQNNPQNSPESTLTNSIDQNNPQNSPESTLTNSIDENNLESTLTNSIDENNPESNLSNSIDENNPESNLTFEQKRRINFFEKDIIDDGLPSPLKDIHIYALYIYEKEKDNFKEHVEKAGIKLNYEFYLGANGYAFEEYFLNFIKKRKHEVINNPIYQKIKEIINGKKYYLKNEKQLGHTRSFINMIRNAKKNKYKKMCILESDVIFIKNFESRIKEYRDIINKSHLFYLGSNDNKLSISTDFLPFNPERSYDKIKKKKPNLNHDELLIEVEKKRVNHHKKRLKFTELIKKNNMLYETQGKYRPYCPYGTFAMIIDEAIYDKVLEVLELQIYPTDVLFFYIQHILDDEKFGTAFPNLVICDVSTSMILEDRNQEKFAEGRGWNLEYYYS